MKNTQYFTPSDNWVKNCSLGNFNLMKIFVKTGKRLIELPVIKNTSFLDVTF